MIYVEYESGMKQESDQDVTEQLYLCFVILILSIDLISLVLIISGQSVILAFLLENPDSELFGAPKEFEVLLS